MFMLGERRQGIIRCVVVSSLHVLPDSYCVGPVQRGLFLMSRDSVSCSINHFMLDSCFFFFVQPNNAQMAKTRERDPYGGSCWNILADYFR